MLVLLDTNAYLRLAKRIKPLVGEKFGQKNYVITVLKDVENEVHRSARLKSRYPWFEDGELAEQRLAKQTRLSKDERAQIEAITSVLRAHVLEHAAAYSSNKRSPPSSTDCFCLAFGQVRPAIVVTDDIGMHHLAREFEITVWHCPELLKKMLAAKRIDNDLIREIYEALERNGDLTKVWRDAKHTDFKKVFGAKPK